MALADKVYDLTQRATAALRINGVLRTDWITMRGGDSFDSPVPFCDIVMPDYTGLTRGMPVTLDAGYDADTIRLFTGGIFSRGDEDPDALRTQCFVRGRTDEDGNTVEATASVISPPAVWPPIPSGQYIDFGVDNSLIWEIDNAGDIAARELGRQARIPRRPSGDPLKELVHATGDLKGAFRSYQIPARDVSGMGVKAAIASVLNDSGIAAYTLNFDDYTLAPSGALLERMPGSEMLDRLMMIRGCRVQQLRSGVVLVQVIEDTPAPTPSFRYMSSDLSLARVIDNPGDVRVPFNPLLQIGMTIEVEDEATHVSGRWFLWGHRWELGANGDFSYMDLRGGEDFGGSIGINPVPQFVYTVELEWIGDVLTAIVQFDATASFDPDGILTDGDISWTDNQTPNLISGTGFRKRVVVPIADIVDPWIVNATATDGDSLTGNEEQTIDTTATGPATYVPSIGAAAGTYSMISPDSAQTWNDNAESTCLSVGMRPADGVHHGHCCFGFLDGHIELTTDGNATRSTVLAAVGSPINEIAWDWRNTNVVWALTEDCRVYISIDEGATWGLYVNLRTKLALAGALGGSGDGNGGSCIGLPAGNAVYIFGGTGTGFPLIAYDPNIGSNAWVQQIVLGDLLDDGAGSADLRIADVTAPGDGSATIILKNAGGRANGSIAIYHTTSAPGPTATWTRATGLTAGLTEGRAMLSNAPLAPVRRIAIFDDRDAWKSLDGIAYTQTTDVLPAGFLCNHALWISDILTGLPAIDGVYILGLEDATGTGGIYKSTDEFLSEVEPLRDSTSAAVWPAGAKAKKVSIGAPGTVSPPSGFLARLSGVGRISTFGGGTHWSEQKAAGSPQNLTRFMHIGDHWFYIENRGDQGDLFHSPDGVTFTNVLPFSTNTGQDSGVHDIAVGPDGKFWALRGHGQNAATNRNNVAPLEVYSSTDGVTWTLEYTDAGWSGGGITNGNTRPGCIAISPAYHILIAGGGIAASEFKTILTTDAFGSVTRLTSGGLTISNGAGFNDTLIYMGTRAIHLKAVTPFAMQYSDDDGANWTACTLSPTQGSGTGRALGEWGTDFFNTNLLLIDSNSGSQFARIYKTEDQGQNWTRIVNGDADSVFAFIAGSLAYHPSSDIAYVAALSGDNVARITDAIAGGAVTDDITFDYPVGDDHDPRTLALPR